jgi:hypothetical protein
MGLHEKSPERTLSLFVRIKLDRSCAELVDKSKTQINETTKPAGTKTLKKPDRFMGYPLFSVDRFK